MTAFIRTGLAMLLLACLALPGCRGLDFEGHRNQGVADAGNHRHFVLEWNQILIDTLIATNTPNSVSQRLGAIVHTAMFDAYNGVRQERMPIYYTKPAPDDADARAALIAASYTALVGLFPSRKAQLDASYAASLGALQSDPGGRAGIDYGETVARAVLEWRAADGFSNSVTDFKGGSAAGQWRPSPPKFGAMSAQAMAFTKPFILSDSGQFRPAPPRGLLTKTFENDFNAVKALGRKDGSTRTVDQTALASIWEGNATVHWNQAANQAARANKLGASQSVRLLAMLNIAMADTAITVWSAKRFYGADSHAVTWRPVTAIPLAASSGNPNILAESDWAPLVITPSHPEYPAGHPALNGAAATVMLSFFTDPQTFTITTPALSDRTYSSISRAREDGNNARIWGGMHYPSTVAISDAVGEAIANHVGANAMQTRKR
jgi:hypothetical protein